MQILSGYEKPSRLINKPINPFFSKNDPKKVSHVFLGSFLSITI